MPNLNVPTLQEGNRGWLEEMPWLGAFFRQHPKSLAVYAASVLSVSQNEIIGIVRFIQSMENRL